MCFTGAIDSQSNNVVSCLDPNKPSSISIHTINTFFYPHVFMLLFYKHINLLHEASDHKYQIKEHAKPTIRMFHDEYKQCSSNENLKQEKRGIGNDVFTFAKVQLLSIDTRRGLQTWSLRTYYCISLE